MARCSTGRIDRLVRANLHYRSGRDRPIARLRIHEGCERDVPKQDILVPIVFTSFSDTV
jgi:hypothetical protein